MSTALQAQGLHLTGTDYRDVRAFVEKAIVTTLMDATDWDTNQRSIECAELHFGHLADLLRLAKAWACLDWGIGEGSAAFSALDDDAAAAIVRRARVAVEMAADAADEPGAWADERRDLGALAGRALSILNAEATR